MYPHELSKDVSVHIGDEVTGRVHYLPSHGIRHAISPAVAGRGKNNQMLTIMKYALSTCLSMQVKLYVFLVQFGQDFVLVDTGAPGKEYSNFLIRGLHEAIGSGRLRLVVLTHGHIDHVGALPALRQTFADAQVAYHAEEAPYLTGQQQLIRSS